jgi:hypothetical protein
LLLPAHSTTRIDNPVARSRRDTPGVSANVLAALPPGSVPARSQAAFLRAVDEHPGTAVLRADGREHLAAIAWVLASTASWADLSTRPTWALLQQRSGLSRAAVARWLAWLRARGLLGVIETGTTPRFAPMALAADAENRAALYQLCTPQPAGAGHDQLSGSEHDQLFSVDETETPTPLGLQENPYARASQLKPGSLREQKPRNYERGQLAWSRTALARTRAERFALAERLQAEAPTLRALSTPALRHLLRPFISRPELGWTVAWLLHALDHSPDGTLRTFTAPVRVPAGWLRFRLSAWTGQDGQPLPSPGIARADAERNRQARAAEARAERAKRDQRAADDQAFSQLIRDVAGKRYPALVQTVLAQQPDGGRLMPAHAAEALTRQTIRELLPRATHGAFTERRPVAAAIDGLLTGASL